MLIEYLTQPRAGDIDMPGEVGDSVVWVKEAIPPTAWQLDEDM